MAQPIPQAKTKAYENMKAHAAYRTRLLIPEVAETLEANTGVFANEKGQDALVD